MTRTIQLNASNFSEVKKETLKVLSSGGLVVFPSDTVYGLLVDATSERAVEKLIAFKNRAPGKAISVFISDFKMMDRLVKVRTLSKAMIKKLLPGPFTIIFDSRHKTSQKLESEKGTLGVRIPDYAPVNTLVTEFGKPVTATSANLGGRHPHYSITSLLNQLPESKKQLIDLIVDSGKLPRNKPSSVIDLRQDTVEILRHGDIVFSEEDEFISTSAKQTRQIGEYVLNQALKNSQGKPIVIIMKGDLGTGKTEMTRGIAGVLGIEKVVSPTYVISYEYPVTNKVRGTSFELFVHADLYNIEDPEEFNHLGLTEYLTKKSIMVIEWGERMGKLYDEFKKRAHVVFITIQHKNEINRSIQVGELS